MKNSPYRKESDIVSRVDNLQKEVDGLQIDIQRLDVSLRAVLGEHVRSTRANRGNTVALITVAVAILLSSVDCSQLWHW
jgi:hypothetical protein